MLDAVVLMLCFLGGLRLGCWMRWANVSGVHVIVGVETIYLSLHILWLCLKCGFSYWGLPTMNGTAFDYGLFHADYSRLTKQLEAEIKNLRRRQATQRL